MSGRGEVCGVIWGALGSVLFQYVGVYVVQFCQYIISILEYSRGSFGGYWGHVGGVTPR